MRKVHIIKLLKGLVKKFKKEQKPAKHAVKPVIIPRAEHPISRNDISRSALKVLYRLNSAGYSAYLVGGCVRDLLLSRKPKDFDICTNAHPEQVRQLFKNCRLIGKRFRLAHIVFGREIIEVATFRTDHDNALVEHAKTHQGMIVRDNVYGTIDDDVWRRDFTVNGLYYNIADFSIIDYVGGMQDIKTRTLRIIGNPEQRYQEDPVRIIRAIRFMGKLNLTISPDTEQHIPQLKNLLDKVSPARLFLEISKLLQEGAILPTFNLLKKHDLLDHLLPGIQSHFEKHPILIEKALADADTRVKESKTVSPAFIFSALIWPAVLHHTDTMQHTKLPEYVIHERAVHDASKDLIERLAIPRNLTVIIREICLLQFRFSQRFGAKPFRLLTHPRFRASYDLLLARAYADTSLKELSDWWTVFIDASDSERETLVKNVEKKPSPNRKRRKKFKTKRNPITTTPTEE